MKHQFRYPDLTGKQFGKLTVAWPAAKLSDGRTYYLVFCECGGFRTEKTVKIVSGKTDRCLYETRVRAHTQHGHAPQTGETPEYRSWHAMIQRCTNPKTIRWARYGGRGIKVCQRWLNSFENFLADMGLKPEPKHRYSIDRYPNNDGNYEPGNCRWATWSQQNRDRPIGLDGRFLKFYEGVT